MPKRISDFPFSFDLFVERAKKSSGWPNVCLSIWKDFTCHVALPRFRRVFVHHLSSLYSRTDTGRKVSREMKPPGRFAFNKIIKTSLSLELAEVAAEIKWESLRLMELAMITWGRNTRRSSSGRSRRDTRIVSSADIICKLAFLLRDQTESFIIFNIHSRCSMRSISGEHFSFSAKPPLYLFHR